MKAMALLLILAGAGGDTLSNAAWPRAELPINVLLGPECAEHQGSVARAVLLVNRACAAEVFTMPHLATLAYLGEWHRSGHGIRSTVVIRADGEFEPPRAFTEPVFSRPGRMYSALVTLPRASLPDWVVRLMITHEMIHAAGYMRHSDVPGNAMFHIVVPGQRLDGEFRDWCRRQYTGGRP